MKIETITVMERKNLGNYEHIEISASAKVEEGDDAYSSLLALKTIVHAALEGKAATMSSVPTAKVEEIKVIVPESSGVSEEDLGGKPKAKAKAKKEKVPSVIDPSELPPVEPDGFISKPVKEKLVAYNSSIAEHKSIFGGYLTKKYENSWKTSHPADEIKSFTASLNGKDFLDNDGKIVESFLNLVHGFFGA
jgi:hypothetical protein